MEHKISAGHVGALAGWTIGLVLVAIRMVEGYRTGELGLLIALASGVWNIRVFLGELEERERRAFNVGRQFERSQRDVTPLR